MRSTSEVIPKTQPDVSPAAAPAVGVPAPDKTRIVRIVRWSGRITSIPVGVLVMTSLLPALASFSISPKDDRIVAVGLCGVFAGLVTGWRWSGIGGGLVLAGVLLMLGQGDSMLYPDPFCVAFGLQGILFLISAVLSAPSDKTSIPAMRWVRRSAIVLLVLAAAVGAVTVYRGPGPIPVPRDKESFIGAWHVETGLTLEITPAGRGKVNLDKDSKIDPGNNPVTGGVNGAFLVYFQADDKLELTTGPFGQTKIYHIDRYPHAEGKQTRMMLNGSDPYNRSGGMVLVKKTAP
jgi:hypothetical protein